MYAGKPQKQAIEIFLIQRGNLGQKPPPKKGNSSFFLSNISKGKV